MKKLLHKAFTIILAIFFIYKGVEKMPIKTSEISTEEIEQLSKGDYLNSETGVKPIGYKITMNTMRTSGFIQMIGIFQILAGFLMIIPITRIIGTFLLLPIIFNIFMMHVFFDNRIDENILCGTLLFINVLLCFFYYSNIKTIIIHTKLTN
tara:strand:+ start:1550 stop:2002 length:453 start_codon:yes stop_codon:yes gene_type:complete